MENESVPMPPPSGQPPASAGPGDWPAVPPAPAPVKPTAPPLGPEPPIINPDAHLIPPPAASTSATAAAGSTPVAPAPPSTPTDAPVTAVPAPGVPSAPPPAVPAPTPPRGVRRLFAPFGLSASPANDGLAAPTVAPSTLAPSTLAPSTLAPSTVTPSTVTRAAIAPAAITPSPLGAPVIALPAAVPSPPPPVALGAAGGDEWLPAVSQHAVWRRQGFGRSPAAEMVWQPRFAYASAAVILLALTVVSMPLWIVFYRLLGTAGASMGDLIALCMMLLGGYLTGAAAWVVIIEMRGRVRMVDTLARSGEREMMAAPAAPELPSLDTPLEHPISIHSIGARPPWEPGTPPPPLAPRVEAHQVSAAATLEASSKLLGSFGGVLKSFGQLPAQIAMLTVALALFVGATVLSLN